MSDIQELLAELRERYENWRTRMRARNGDAQVEETPEIPGVEFVSLDPLAPPAPIPPRTFADIKLAWIATLCDPEVLAQGEQCARTRRVTRVHALGNRMTGTVQEMRYEDQEIFLQDGRLIASCTCDQTTRAGSKAANYSELRSEQQSDRQSEQLSERQSERGTGSNVAQRENSGTGRTLRCRHVVAILLAYIQQQNREMSVTTSARSNNTTTDLPPSASVVKAVVCPVTRQPLVAGQPFYQCIQCGMAYSDAGWEFLRKADKGRCCGCERRKTVQLVKPSPTTK